MYCKLLPMGITEPTFLSNSNSKSVMLEQSKIIFMRYFWVTRGSCLTTEETLQPVTQILAYCQSACCPTAHCPSLTRPQWERQDESPGKAKQAVASEYIWQHHQNASGPRGEPVKYWDKHIQFCIGRVGTEVDSHPKDNQPLFVLWLRNDTSDSAVPVFLVKGKKKLHPLQVTWGKQSKSNIKVKTCMILLSPAKMFAFVSMLLKHSKGNAHAQDPCWKDTEFDGGKLMRSLSHTYGCSGETKPSKSAYPNQLTRTGVGDHLWQYWHLGKFFCSGTESSQSCQSLPISILRGALPPHCSKTLASAQIKSSSSFSSYPNCQVSHSSMGTSCPSLGLKGHPAALLCDGKRIFAHAKKGLGQPLGRAGMQGFNGTSTGNTCNATGRKFLQCMRCNLGINNFSI